MYFPKYQREFRERYAANFDELDQVKWQIVRADKTDVIQCLKIITSVEGFRIPTGSGLLAVLFPEHFGTIDKLILRAFWSMPSVNTRYHLEEWT